MVLQVLVGHHTTLFLERVHNGIGDGAGVKGLRAAFGNGVQRIGQAGQAHHLPDSGRTSTGQVVFGVGAVLKKGLCAGAVPFGAKDG